MYRVIIGFGALALMTTAFVLMIETFCFQVNSAICSNVAVLLSQWIYG
jgi:hypothetical protein